MFVNGNEPLSIVKWLTKDVEIVYKNKILTIKSPVLYTDENIVERFSGMKYMKLLT